MSRAQGRALNRGLRSRVTERSRVGWSPSASTILAQYGTEYWLASSYAAAGSSGSWLGAKGVADLALPGGSNNPSFYTHSTSVNPFGAGVDYVRCPGTASNYISTPDTAALDITGDITLVMWYQPDASWKPGSIHYPLAKYSSSATISYAIRFISSDPGVTLRISADGSTANDIAPNANIQEALGSGVAGWVAISLDVDNGAGGKDVKFWTSTNGTSWTQLGTTVTQAGTTSLFSSSSPLTVMGYIGGAITSAGNVARAQVYSGVRDFSGTPSGGTLVADFNPNGGTFNTTETTLTGTGDSLTWTINRSASGRRAWAITRDAWSFGTDDYLSVADNANFDFGASQDFTVAALFRAKQEAGVGVYTLIVKRDASGTNAGWGGNLQNTGSATQFRFAICDGATLTAVNDATWDNPGQLQTHIGTRTAGATGTMTIYTDAVSVGGAGALPGDLSNARTLYVGATDAAGTPTNFFEGLIHGLAISRTGLTAAQVLTLDTELRSVA